MKRRFGDSFPPTPLKDVSATLCRWNVQWHACRRNVCRWNVLFPSLHRPSYKNYNTLNHRTGLIVVINLLNRIGCLISTSRIIVKMTIKMGPTRTNSTSAQNPKKEEVSNHLVDGAGPVVDGSSCVIRTSIWVPTLIPKNFFSTPFLCGSVPLRNSKWSNVLLAICLLSSKLTALNHMGAEKM